MKRVLWAAALLGSGVLGAFFGILVPLFADGPANKLHPEYLVAYGLIIGFYALVMWAAIRYGPWGWWSAVWLGAPGALLLVAYMDSPWLLRGLVGLAFAAGLGLGGVLGRWRT